MEKIRRFAKARLAEQSGVSKKEMSLAEIEQKFVDKFTEKYHLSERDIARAFKRFDRDGSGFLDANELTTAISMFLNGVDRSRVASLVQCYDVDGDGSISIEEFTTFLLTRNNLNRDEWMTVDKLAHSNNLKSVDAQNTSLDESIDEIRAYNLDSSREEGSAPQSASARAKVFLQSMKSVLLRQAVDMRNNGKIATYDRLSMHANPLAEATARTILAKTILPLLKGQLTLDLSSFTRALLKFVHPGTLSPRSDVAEWLFTSCGGQLNSKSHAGKTLGADPAALAEMVFDVGGAKINKWGFVQPVTAVSDSGRPAIAKGPIIKKAGSAPATIRDIALRYQTRRCHTSLAAPSVIDPSLLDRSTRLPNFALRRQFVYGITTPLSGEPILSIAAVDEGVILVYASAALVVLHDMSTNTQKFFEGHCDDVTCFAVSCAVKTGLHLVASGSVQPSSGHLELLLWESSLGPTISTPSPLLTQYPHLGTDGFIPSQARVRGGNDGNGSPTRGGRAAGLGVGVGAPPAGLIARIGRGFFQRCIIGTAFSHDAKYVLAIGGDDKHSMGVWCVTSGEMVASVPTSQGIPPQIKAVQFSPCSFQETSFIDRDHLDLDCDLICTAGKAASVKFWSFLRPNSAGYGAGLTSRLHSIGRVSAPQASIYTSVAFITRTTTTSSSSSRAPQYDVVTGGDNGYMYLWRNAACCMAKKTIPDGAVGSIQVVGTRLYVAGAKGCVCIVDGASFETLLVLGTSSDTPAVLKSRPSSAPTAAAGAPTVRANSAGGAIFNSKAPPASRSRPKVVAKKAAAGSQWTGPGVRDIVPITQGTLGSSTIIGLVVLHPTSSSSTPTLLATSGYGKVLKICLPSARAISSGFIPIWEPILYTHYGPVWAVASPPSLTPTSIIASGGDDSWLSVWDARRNVLSCRNRTGTPIRSLGFCWSERGRAIGLEAGYNIIAAGHVSGIVTVHLMSCAKGKTSSSKSIPFERGANDSAIMYSLTEIARRRDSSEELSVVAFSPTNTYLAAATHDNHIDIYTCKYHPVSSVVIGLDSTSSPASMTLKPFKRLRGHSSYLRSLDWSLDSTLIRSCCGAHEVLFWDVSKGTQMLSSGDCLEGDTVWGTCTVVHDFGVMGVWGAGAGGMKGTDINAVDAIRVESSGEAGVGVGVCVTGDDKGRLNLFNWPCIVEGAPSKVCKVFFIDPLHVRLYPNPITPSTLYLNRSILVTVATCCAVDC